MSATLSNVAIVLLIAAVLFVLVVLGGLVAMVVHKPTRPAGIAIVAFLGLVVMGLLGFAFVRVDGGPARVSHQPIVISEAGAEHGWPAETRYIESHDEWHHSQSQHMRSPFGGKIIVSSWAKLFVTILLAAIVGLLTGGERVRSVAVRMLGVSALLIGGLGVLYFFVSAPNKVEIATYSPPVRVHTEALPPVAPVPPVAAEHTVGSADTEQAQTTTTAETPPASASIGTAASSDSASSQPVGNETTAVPAASESPESKPAEPAAADAASPATEVTQATPTSPNQTAAPTPPAGEVPAVVPSVNSTVASDSAEAHSDTATAAKHTATAANEAVPSSKAATEEVTKPKLAQSPAAARPDWIDKPSQRVGSDYLTHVKSGLFSTFEECERALAIASRNAIREYAIDYLGNEEIVTQMQLTPEFLRKLQRQPDYQEQVNASVGPMTQLHRQLVIDDAARNELRSMWENVIRGRRLWYLGSGALLVLSLIGTLFSYLKLDLITGGTYRGRLQLVATSAILVATAAAIVVRKW